ncbi:hypothetical protein [Bacillus paramycoides]|uniref:hypothetical protein n=1 Tax=Bacillus paramycoides TaxID=2026194 RepID=UPI003D01AE0E
MENSLSFLILLDEYLVDLKAYDVFYHGDAPPYEAHGTHEKPAYFLVEKNEQLLY